MSPSLNPFPGPQPYRATDRARFYGRDTVAAKLEASILANRCVTVHGPSGAGKSSLVQASVLPSLIESHDARAVRVDAWPEGEDPVLWLALSMFSDLKLGEVTLGLSPTEAVIAAAKRAARASSRLMVVYLDQLEQLFYPGRSHEQTEPFFACLQDLVELPLRTVRVVLSLREDYLGRFRDRLRDRGRVLDNSFRVGPLTVAELTEAVCQAAAAGEPPQAWSPDEMRSLMLQVRVPGQAAGEEAEAQAAYAQIVCRALFTQRAQSEGASRTDAAEAEPILRGYLETTLRDLGPLREPAQCLLEDHLVTADGSRTLRTEKELLREVPAAELQPILRALEGAAILHAEEHQGSRYFEIGHDWLARKVFEQRQAREAEEEQRRREEAQQREQELREAEMARRLAKARRDRLRLLGLAAGALVFAAVTGVLFYIARQEREIAQQEKEKARRESVEAKDQRILAGYLALASRGDRSLAMKLLPEVKLPAQRDGWASYASDALTENALRATLRGHLAPLTAAAFFPDGKRVLTAAHDGTARVWNADGTGQSTVLRGHADPLTFAAVSPDGKRILTTSEDGTARVWDAADGKHIEIATGKGPMSCGAWSPDGKRVAVGGEDGILRIRSVDGAGEALDLQGHEGPLRDLAFLPDGARVVTASDDATARLWTVGSGEPPVKLGVHGSPVHTVAVSRDGSMIVTTTGERVARLFVLSGNSARMERAFDCGASDAVHAAIAPDSDRVAVACADGTVRLSSVKAPGPPVVLTGATGLVSRVAFRPDGKFLAAASQDTVTRVYRVHGGDPALVLVGHAGGIGALAWSPDGARLVTAASDQRKTDFCAKVWSAEELRASARTDRAEAPVHAASFGKGGTLLAAAHDDNTASLRRVDGEGRVIVFKGHEGWVAAAAVSPAGDRVVTASFDGTARIWSADGQGQPIVLKGHSGGVLFAAWSPNGARVVTAADDGTARIWDAAKEREPLATLSGHEDWVLGAGWSPDGARVVTASSDHTARIWSAAGEGSPVVLGGYQGAVSSAVFSPDGARIFTTSDAGPLQLWSASGTREASIRPVRETDTLLFAAPSAGGRWLAATSEDGLIHVWSRGDRPMVLTPQKPVLALTFVENDRTLLAAFDDGTTHRWQIDVETLRSQLRKAHADCLPVEVRAQYLDETLACATYAFELCESEYGRRPAPVKPAECAVDAAPAAAPSGSGPSAGLDLTQPKQVAPPGTAAAADEGRPRRRAKDLGPEGRHVKLVVLPGDADVTIGGMQAQRRSGVVELIGKKGDRVRVRVSKEGEFLEQDVTLEDQGTSPPLLDLRPKIVPQKAPAAPAVKQWLINLRSFLPE